ncbi:hypothetical protein C9374_012868 [Naegleria lovaniensis]|uniref:Uncharacterized protein n=1 Tax=Naegleria lovaniensis TaxID=51637 RepID=A0AA88GAW9_NAELO|nr:uncharacterized protein C9374_012868 [Naegleria lovaniensis]KAG2373136.1 hypothetical protein C9374_012868 [Naegleria lovaniensis]
MVFKPISQFINSHPTSNNIRSSRNVTSVLGRLLFDQSYMKRGGNVAFYSTHNNVLNTTSTESATSTDTSSTTAAHHHKKKKHLHHRPHGEHKTVPEEQAASGVDTGNAASDAGTSSAFSSASYLSKQYDDSTEDDVNAEKSSEALPWDRERESKILGKKANEIDEIKWNEAEDKPHSSIYKKAEEVFVLKKEFHIMENKINRDTQEKGLKDDRQHNESGASV